jgi:hypothetical protein
MNISNYIALAKLLLMALVFVSLLVKIALYYKVEKNWDPIRFMHFSKIDLKMTVSKDLRVWRKRQNFLSHVFLLFTLLFIVTYFFHRLIAIK